MNYYQARSGKRLQCLRCQKYLQYSQQKYCSTDCKIKLRNKIRCKYRRFKKGQCAICASKQDLSVHHIDGLVINNAPENLMTLCSPCHSVLDGKDCPKRWKKLKEMQNVLSADTKLSQKTEPSVVSSQCTSGAGMVQGSPRVRLRKLRELVSQIFGICG